MDAHVFRRFGEALVELLEDARLEKIQSPSADVHVFTFYARQHKHILVLRHDRRNPYLFLSPQRPSGGQHPSAATMRLRKYAAGRRVKACVLEWAARRLHLCFHTALQNHESAPMVQPETWITLDLRAGPVLVLGTRPESAEAPVWPTADEALRLCTPASLAERAWEQWPVLTPALRRTLPLLAVEEQAALLADLAYGGGDLFVYPSGAGNADISAWPLPAPLRGARQESVFDDPCAALAPVGVHAVLGGLERAGQRAAASPHSREAQRLTRVLEKLDREEQRLQAMLAGKERALYVQSVLWYFPPDARPDALISALANDAASLPPCPFDPQLLPAEIRLRDSMEALFHGAARGARGLALVTERRILLRGQVAAAQDSALLSALLFTGVPALQGRAAVQNAPRAPLGRTLPKNVEVFTSVDGLSIFRGKDAKGNLALLKLGAPTDVWLHVAGGPGAHTLVRRAFVGQDIPMSTLEQAATLAALKSWQKGNEHVEVQCAQVRHLKPLRGASTGTVRIDKLDCMVRVTLPVLG
ncbi:MAG: NFACT RNA binding domain-containing protein [Desulfovibrionaceae bacterium]